MRFHKKSVGPVAQLGRATEMKLVKYDLNLQLFGFAPTRREVRKLAFILAESLGIYHTFNRENAIAGKVCL